MCVFHIYAKAECMSMRCSKCDNCQSKWSVVFRGRGRSLGETEATANYPQQIPSDANCFCMTK